MVKSLLQIMWFYLKFDIWGLQLTDFLEILLLINNYLDYGKRDDFKEIDKQLSTYLIAHEFSLQKKRIEQYNEDVSNRFKQILIALNLDPLLIENHDYASLTFEQFFIKLSQVTEDPLIMRLTNLIKKKLSFAGVVAILVSFLGVSVFSAIVNTTNVFNAVKNTLKRFFNSTKAMPIIGFVFSNMGTALELLGILLDRTKQSAMKKREALFLSLTLLFNVTAYSLWIVGFGMMPVIGAFFMMASIMISLKHAFSLASKAKQYRHISESRLTHPSAQEERAKIRLESGFKLHRNLLINNLLASIGILAFVAITSFLPLTPLIMVGCIVGMILLQVATSIIAHVLKRNAETQLQNDLGGVGGADDASSAEASSELSENLDASPRHSPGPEKEHSLPSSPSVFLNEDADISMGPSQANGDSHEELPPHQGSTKRFFSPEDSINPLHIVKKSQIIEAKDKKPCYLLEEDNVFANVSISK